MDHVIQTACQRLVDSLRDNCVTDEYEADEYAKGLEEDLIEDLVASLKGALQSTIQDHIEQHFCPECEKYVEDVEYCDCLEEKDEGG